MNNKTCGECKHFSPSDEGQCMDDEWTFCDSDACDKFQSKVVTNGDKIRHGGNRALAEFQQLNTCDNCIYNNGSGVHEYCDKPIDKTCTDGIEAWLNAPAESEKEK